MAAATVISAMSADSDKTIHPFFTRPKGNDPQQPSASNSDDQVLPDATNEDESDYDPKAKRSNSKRQKKVNGGQPAEKKKGQKTLGEIINPKPVENPQPEVVNLCTSELDLNDDRRKRRRTSQTGSADVGSERPSTPPSLGDTSDSPQIIISASSPLPNAPTAPNHEILAPQTPPKKLLKLNANGKFSSPPPKAGTTQEDPDSEPPKRRTRQRKAAQAAAEKQSPVKIKYGTDDLSRKECGDRIMRILNGEERIATATVKIGPKKRTPQKPKATHPFFVGKKEPPVPPKQESPRKASAVTPGKLRKQTGHNRRNTSKDQPTFDSALLKDRHMVKHPGARDPPFPSKDWTHVRGSDSYYVKQPMNDETFERLYHKRKRKQARHAFPEQESILSNFSQQLTVGGERKLRPDGFYEPHEDLNIPERLLISGEEIAEAVAKELSAPIRAAAEDELSLTSPQLAVHPALRTLFQRIPDTMTAYDELKGESASWTQKYTPMSAAEVLQPASEVAVLKNWLRLLSVQAVSGAAAAPPLKFSTKAQDKPKKKRKKKPDGLDDFLVDDDEETNEMSEIPDDDSVALADGPRAVKSIVQAVGDNAKLNNAVLLSGPHGCGKSAAAYAVAREMGYKVFEISSSERRSGRDVLDKVGDMTENHLVKHHGSESAEVSSSEEQNRIDEAFQNDLQGGKQGKMSAFFKPQTKPKAKPKEPQTVVKEKTIRNVQEALRKQPKDQQQSLILLEEVDILFKDDKEFWTTVFKLITTSKRPFIMTCNDEDLVPLQAMSLHAILRFTQPPADLATDYMLLIAAAEGHVLTRSAVTALYERHSNDLRASLMELDYWCQMGIGDPREGLSWIYQRWPPGSDLDKYGRRLRVVSNGTYREGMGVASRSATSVEEALSEAWEEFDVEPASALGWTTASSTTMMSLENMCRLADALSAADSSCGSSLSESLDATQPELPDNARGNYIEGLTFLQTDERVDHSDMSKKLVVATALLAGQAFGLPDQLPPNKDSIIAKATTLKASSQDDNLSRRAFSCFDVISGSPEVSQSNSVFLQSAFDGTLETISLDLAPYVRSIVQHEQALDEQRQRLDLLTSDGRQAKRARTTRAARSAQDGGVRAKARKERWFHRDLDFNAVLATGGESWPQTCPSAAASVDEGSRVSTDAAPSTAAAAAAAAEEEIKYE